jgi:colanic acid/amylovoran biosynthesis glycosyltransferase
VCTSVRAMRIAYLSSVYPRASDTFTRNEARELRALGHEVHPFAVRRPEAGEIVSDEVSRERASTEYLLDAGVARLGASALRSAASSPLRFVRALTLAWRTRAPGAAGLVRAVAYVLEAAYLAERMRALGIEHLHCAMASASSAAMLASTLSGVPFSMTIHGPLEFDDARQLRLGEKVARAAFCTAISSWSRAKLYRWCEYEHWHKIHIVRCGVDERFLTAARTDVPDVPRIVTVGRLSEQKGLPLLLEAMRAVLAERPDAELAVIGDGPLRGELEHLIRRLALGSHVRLLGWSSADAVREAIAGSRGLVMASLAEGIPVVIMEALALNRPVVATAVGGIPELVEPGVSGWVVTPGSVGALAGALRELLEAPPEQLTEMGRAGAASVAARHDVRAEAATLAQLIATAPHRDGARR